MDDLIVWVPVLRNSGSFFYPPFLRISRPLFENAVNDAEGQSIAGCQGEM